MDLERFGRAGFGDGSATNTPSVTASSEGGPQAAHTAVGAAASVNTTAPKAAAWTCTIDSDTIAQSIVSGSTLFVTAYTETAAGKAAGGCVLHAIDIVRGTELWHRSFPGDSPAYTMEVADNVVLVANDYNSNSSGSAPDEVLFAYDAAGGASAWQSTATYIFGPIVSGAVAYIVTADSSGASQLLALDVTTGSNSWSPVSLGDVYAEALLVSGDSLYAPIDDDARTNPTWRHTTATTALTALNLTTGAQNWTAELSGNSVTEAVILDDTIYVGSYNLSKSGAGEGDCVLHALNAGDGSVLWHVPVAGAYLDAPAIVGSRLYLGGAATSGSSVISAYDI